MTAIARMTRKQLQERLITRVDESLMDVRACLNDGDWRPRDGGEEVRNRLLEVRHVANLLTPAVSRRTRTQT